MKEDLEDRIKKIGFLLRRQRRMQNLSQKALGEKLAEYDQKEEPYTAQYISAVERGGDLRVSTLIRQLDVLGLEFIIQDKEK